jgi:hypothetical protein
MQCFKEAILTSKLFLDRSQNEDEVIQPGFIPTTATREIRVSLLTLPSSSVTFVADPNMYSQPIQCMVTGFRPRPTSSKQLHDDDGDGDDEQQTVDESLLFSRISTILIFNMALAHHAKAMTTITSSVTRQDLLIKAKDLYSLAYSVPQQEQDQDIIGPALLPLFVKAILNNLGRCYACLNDDENSIACFEMLLGTIILFQQDQTSDSSSSSNNDIHDCIFLQNTMFLILKDPGFAPAA